MKHQLRKLNGEDVGALVALSKAEGFPQKLNEETAERYCRSSVSSDAGVSVYGVFEEGRLVSVMTASVVRVFPCHDAPRGKIVHITGAYTHPDARHKGYATALLNRIEEDAQSFGADYLCCDSIADALYLSSGFLPAPEGETRLWKTIHLKEETT